MRTRSSQKKEWASNCNGFGATHLAWREGQVVGQRMMCNIAHLRRSWHNEAWCMNVVDMRELKGKGLGRASKVDVGLPHGLQTSVVLLFAMYCTTPPKSSNSQPAIAKLKLECVLFPGHAAERDLV
ncbi:hypothetical protein VNO77_37862 [Canavalia gladiata]|uniref:Uncharacterized protein n=1 Tax=Canavalia gladiata TaxID=3824 RepID=A0AAN9PW94_CANGL